MAVKAGEPAKHPLEFVVDLVDVPIDTSGSGHEMGGHGGLIICHVTANNIGHGHLNEFVMAAPTDGSVEVGRITTAPTPGGGYFAVCPLQHEAGTTGVDPTSLAWTSRLTDICWNAKGEADAHEDGGARVVQQWGGLYLGPINCI
jgi:hypothetical protein